MGENTMGTGEGGADEDERWREFDVRFRPRREDPPPGEDFIHDLVKGLRGEDLSPGRDAIHNLGLAPDLAEETTQAEEDLESRTGTSWTRFQLLAAAPAILMLLYFLYQSKGLAFQVLLAFVVAVLWRKLVLGKWY